MWPLLDFVGDDEISSTKEILEDLKEDLDFEIKRAIDEVVEKNLK
jgi:hypothetical protein